DADGREVRAAGAGLVRIDAVDGVVPGAVVRAIDVNAAAGVCAAHHARLDQHQVDGVAPTCAHDRQVADRRARQQIADIPGGFCLDLYDVARDLYGLGNVAHFQRGIDGQRLPDRELVVP